MGSELFPAGGLTRLAVCAVVATAAVVAAEKLCAGKGWPLWDKYGGWLIENRVQSIAILAAALYGVWLALAPSGSKGEEDGFSRCEV